MSEHDDAGAGRAGTVRGSEQELDRPRAWLTGIGFGALVLIAMVISFVIGTNYSDDPAPVGPAASKEEVPALPEKASEEGRELFVASCGSCHTLSDAGTSGSAGPDLDSLAPDRDVVEGAIANGGTGTGMMPPGLLTGKDAQQVAEYVSTAAGGG